uniref:Sushi, von Willebrand factor type A, EGF and pentraxin domain-containing protein 1-like n=1 Tax=Crassostrea virginica TaxID=6565 RepID=A0A8B8CLR2_CRAVI|nr:sushi, von Willebrand factor type A, EGF and pentraxin domain-containing protein 1-like [Crassostrea virginica]
MYVTASVVSIEDMYQGNKLKGVEILLEIPNIGVNTCAAECLAYVDCLSINYDMESYVCELNTEISDDIDEKKDKYIHATKLQLQTNPKIHVCEKNCDLPCSARQKCVHSTTGKATCVYTHCEEPPELNNGNLQKLSNKKEVGSTAEYSCKKDYGFYGPMSSTCSTNGQWTTIGECLPSIVTCNGAQPSIANATSNGNYNTTCGSRAPFICNHGYLGTVYSVCEETGNWAARGKCKAYCPENFFEEVDVDGKLLKLCWQIFPSEYTTYDLAIKACQSKSPTGRLIILDTTEKQTRVRKRLMSSSQPDSSVFWVNGKFDGTGYFFSNGDECNGFWFSGQPDRSGNCVAVVQWSGNFSWDDRHCVKKHPFICEADIY